jgi:hypothetical protein
MAITPRRSTSSADAPLRSGEAGFSLVEVVLVMAGLAAFGVMFGETMIVSLGADRYVSAFNAAATKGQRSSNEIEQDLTAARRVYSLDDEGRDYAAATEVFGPNRPSEMPKPLTSSLLPLVDPLGSFAPDTQSYQTAGNALLFVREQGSAVIDTIEGPEARSLRFDLFRFVGYYLTKKPGPTVGGNPDRLDLIRWQSVPFASRTQAVAIFDPDERAEALAALRADFGVEHVWDPGQPVEVAFYAIDTDGTMAATPEDEFLIRSDRTQPTRPFFIDKRSSVAWNGGETQVPVPKYGYRNDSQDGFPHGFEIKVIGQAGSRQVLVRLALLGWTPPGHTAYADSTVIVPMREF